MSTKEFTKIDINEKSYYIYQRLSFVDTIFSQEGTMFGLTLFSRMSFLPYRAKSLQEFADIVLNKKGKEIIINPYNRILATSCSIVKYKYVLEFQSTASSGHRIVYHECPFTYLFDETDTEGMYKEHIRLILMAVERRKSLDQMLSSDVSINIIGIFGCSMDEKMYDNLLQDAKYYGISV